ncbi:RecB family exonuclease [Clostridium nigeriense]|uniref:RecB family exonuclease n=1 Tax=Clostridium nigeriense TaxID=1805470 RepID=UPI003D32BE9A
MTKKLLLSNTSINTFYNHKDSYKKKYIEKVGYQSKKSKNLSFGNSIHSSLNEFNLLSEKEQTLKALERLLNKNWITEGYNSTEEMLNNFIRAKNILSIYFKDRKDFGKTLLSEEMVYYNVNNVLTICGKIDKVFINNDGKIELLDYKTGTTNNLMIDINTDIQLPLYIVLIKHRLNIVPDIISYYYLTNNNKISLEITEDVINICLDRLKSIIADMYIMHKN